MDNHVRNGTVGGTMTVLLLIPEMGQLVSTILLAATGATVSFLVSAFLRYLQRRLTRK